MSLYKAIQETNSTGLLSCLSLLVLNSLFFLLVLYEFPTLKIMPWQLNKMVSGHKTCKLGRQSSNNHNCQICLTSLHWLWRKCNLTIFPLQVYGSFLLPWQSNQRQTGNILAILNCSFPRNILGSYCFSGFGEVVTAKYGSDHFTDYEENAS